MDNAQKAIMIGVGLFITIIIIAAVMAITGMGQKIMNQGSSQVGNLSSQLQQQLTSDYDNVSLTGADVVNGIQKYYNDKDIVVYLFNSRNGDAKCTSAKKLNTAPSNFNYGDVTTTDSVNVTDVSVTDNVDNSKVNQQPTIGSLNDSSNTTWYINPRASYQSKLIKTNDNVVCGVVFYKK